MTSRYRVEYALKTHRRDQFIEWIKGLLAVPFVLYSQPTGVFDTDGTSVARTAEEAHRRYAEIFRDVEYMIDDHIARQIDRNPHPSKLTLLVPGAGPFFTRLPLEAAFKFQDNKRHISSRRFVAPSFNDVRLVLNSAQAMAVTSSPSSAPSRLPYTATTATPSLQLATFDGDVTLYDDGESLEPSSPLVPRLLDLLRRNVKIGIVTAAGYTTADRYHDRLHGLLDAVAASPQLTPSQRRNVIIMGGEANYLFEFDPTAPHLLSPVPREAWLTPEMAAWSEPDIAALLDVAEAALNDCVAGMRLPAHVIRKDRAVGIVSSDPAVRIPRESLEETVLVVQKILELSALGWAAEGGDRFHAGEAVPSTLNPATKRQRIPFCAFNGGRDVFVDIGDKSWGVAVCQKFFASREPGAALEGQDVAIRGENTLHVGDQFLSAGSNDFKARSVGTTAWIASPAETVELLDELAKLMDDKFERGP